MTGELNGRALSVSVVIPTRNAAPFLPRLLAALFSQEPAAPTEVVLVDSLSTDATCEAAASDARVRVVPIADFSHGRARNLGAREARGEIVVLLTQDAEPADSRWLSSLLAPFADSQVVAAYSRQIPRDDANPMEQFFLENRFPPGPALKRVRTDERPLMLEDVFFSNVSAAIRREILLRHPFDEELIMSEDQQFSRDVIAAGYAVCYQPGSVVRHSHNYTLGVCFRRYFDSVYSLTTIFPRHRLGKTASIGARYLVSEARTMLLEYPAWLPYYVLYNLSKIGGSLAAHFAEALPKRLSRVMSLHRYYWDK